jgi:hypothetical protein
MFKKFQIYINQLLSRHLCLNIKFALMISFFQLSDENE